MHPPIQLQYQTIRESANTSCDLDISPAVIGWLGRILSERFGQHFRLSQSDSRFIVLSISGAPSSIRIASDWGTFTRADSDLDYCEWDAVSEGWRAPLERPLPAPGAARLPSPLISKTSGGFTINYDFIGLAYWMMSRQEEVARTDLDSHGRFPATSSHAYKHGYLERPVIDEWMIILEQVVERLWPGLRLTRHQFEMRVSHDVDSPSRYGLSSPKQLLRSIAGDLIKRNDYRNAMKAPLIWLQRGRKFHNRDPHNTFDWIMDLSERHALTSAFYFICGRTDPGRDANYDPEYPAIRLLMRRIHSRGHEIGLHPSYNTYQNPGAIALEAARLKRICHEEGIEQHGWGGRMHYLRWQTPTTLYGWEEARMTYDSTLSYADRPGFRCGTCYEYPAFDPVAGRLLNLRIRPLIAMECTVIAAKYLNLGAGDAAQEKFNHLKQACRAVNGCFTLLWHNSRLNTNQERALYSNLLAR